MKKQLNFVEANWRIIELDSNLRTLVNKDPTQLIATAFADMDADRSRMSIVSFDLLGTVGQKIALCSGQ